MARLEAVSTSLVTPGMECWYGRIESVEGRGPSGMERIGTVESLVILPCFLK